MQKSDCMLLHAEEEKRQTFTEELTQMDAINVNDATCGFWNTQGTSEVGDKSQRRTPASYDCPLFPVQRLCCIPG